MVIGETKKQIKTCADIAPIMTSILQAEHETDRDKEHFWVVGLNNKNVILYLELVSLGTLTSGLVHPREVFRFAISKAVASIILCHNHPSGDPTPSKEDVNVTQRLVDCGKIIGINVLDHIVIGGNGDYFAFSQHGLL